MRNTVVVSLMVLFIIACETNHRVKKGDEVWLNVTLTNMQGQTIDQTGFVSNPMPLHVKANNKEILNGMDAALINMKRDERKKIQLLPQQAYGKSGVFYLNDDQDTVYVVYPTDTLYAEITVLKVIPCNN